MLTPSKLCRPAARLLCAAGLLLLLCLGGASPLEAAEPPAQAAADRWEWIHSSADYGYFFDKETLTTEQNRHGKITSVSLWLKVKFAPRGAQQEIRENGLDITPAELSKGYALYRLTTDFPAGNLRLHDRLWYTESGALIKDDTEPIDLTVDQFEDFYAPVYAYLGTYLAGTEDFEIWKKKNNYLSGGSAGPNARLLIPEWRIYMEDGKIHFVNELAYYTPEHILTGGIIMYEVLDPESNAITTEYRDVCEPGNTSWTRELVPAEQQKIYAAPGTNLEQSIRYLKKFCESHPAYMKRYEGGGLTPKEAEKKDFLDALKHPASKTAQTASKRRTVPRTDTAP